MSLTLYLLGKKGYEVLKALVELDKYTKHIDMVVGADDRGNKEDCYEGIKDICAQYGIRCTNRDEKVAVQSDFSFAIGWRWLINDQKNLIVLHDSYLPKYRGFSSVVNMLINGENYLGATAIWASEKMDEGNIIIRKKIDIKYPLKIEKAIELVADLYVGIVLNLTELILKKEVLKSTPQENEQATYSIWRNAEDYFINWADDAAKITRFVDAVGYPYEGAKTRTQDGVVIRILDCMVVENIISELYAPGKLLMYEDDYPIILCGQNAVKLLKFEDLNGNSFVFKKFRTRLM